MPAHRAFQLSIVFCVAAVLLVAPAAWAQEDPVVAAEPAQPPAAPPQTQQQGQTLSTGNPSHNTEASFFVGGLVGGDLATLVDDGFSLSSTIENGRTYGGRLGYYTFPLGVEGSFTYSNSGLGITAGFDQATVKIGARVMYLEANALLILLPGPVQPFVTGGGGFHSYEFLDLAGVKLQKFGWNFGGGVKVNIKRVSLRVDVRDHLTQFTAADLNIDQEFADLLNIGTQSLHNAELTFGIGFRF